MRGGWARAHDVAGVAVCSGFQQEVEGLDAAGERRHVNGRSELLRRRRGEASKWWSVVADVVFGVV